MFNVLVNRKCFFVLLCCFCCFSQAIARQPFSKNLNNGVAYRNVCYKVAGKDSLKLDIFLPSQKGKTDKLPVLMMIHGGAWVQGDKDIEHYYYMKTLRDSCLSNGFAVISVNYRLLNQDSNFPGPIQDCKDAVRWVRAHSDKYGLDTGNIGLTGESAGAHLALMVADSPDSLWQVENTNNLYFAHVNYVIDNFGPVDLNQLFKTNAGGLTIFFFKTFLHKLYVIRNNLIKGMTGEDFKGNKSGAIAILGKCSPLTYISSKSVPTLLFHGTKDKVVPLMQSEELLKKLQKNKVESTLVKVPGGNHGFTNIPKKEINQLVAQSLAFMKAHLKD